MSVERWLPCPGHPGYEVSDHGRVRSLKWGEPHILSGVPKKSGHLQVKPFDGNVGRWRPIHQLVMAAFVGAIPEGLEVRHLDGDPSNNALTNLRYGTHSENMLDAVRHGTHAEASKTHCDNDHEFTPENTYWRPNSTGRPWRECKVCRRRQRAASYARRVGRLADTG